MIKKYIEQLKLTPAYDIYRYWQERNAYDKWKKKGCPVPPPPVVKQETVKTCAQRFSLDTLIETGTYLGEMVRATKHTFQRIISIEINETLARKAQKKFSGYSHITIIQGDSSHVIKKVLDEVQKPCLFWLDSHYSGGLTAKGASETPVMQELEHIFSHRIRNHVILIDDARCFNGEHGYPDMQELRDFVMTKRPGWICEVQHDIILIHEKDKEKNTL